MAKGFNGVNKNLKTIWQGCQKTVVSGQWSVIRHRELKPFDHLTNRPR